MKRFSLLLVGAGVLAGCGGGDGGGGGPPTITSVVVSGDSTVFLNVPHNPPSDRYAR